MEELVNLVTARTPAGNLQEAVRKTLDSVVDRVNLLSAVEEVPDKEPEAVTVDEAPVNVPEEEPKAADIVEEETVEETEED